MNQSVQHLLDVFERLSPAERLEAMSEILSRTRDLDLPPLDEETIDRIAEGSFLDYDAREAEDGNG